MRRRQRIEADRVAVERRVAELAGTLASVIELAAADPGDDEHDPDGSTIAFERQQVAALLRSAEAELAALDAALARVDAGTDGTCERCGGPIGAERLDAIPTTRRCVTCAARP